MSIPGSTVLSVKQFLFNLADGFTPPDSTTSYKALYGPPQVNQAGQYVWVGDVIDRTVTPFAMVGDGETGAFREDYTVEVKAYVYHGAQDPQTIDATLLALVDLVETTVRADMSLGAAVNKCSPSRSTSSLAWAENNTGVVGEATITLAVFAVL